MRASNKAPSGNDMRIDAEVPELVDAVLAGRLGYCVRCRPGCRTLIVRTGEPGLGTVFCKIREGRRDVAAAEWHWLHLLPMLGVGVPQPLAFERRGARTLICTAPAPGRPLDAQLREALVPAARVGAARLRSAGLDAGEPAAAVDPDGLRRVVRFACAVVAPRIRQLHAQGLVFRDLYWNHLFATSLRDDAELVFLDVERVLRPRVRRFRWVAKDLAGLWSSLPVAVPARAGLRFLRAYLGDRGGERWLRRKLARAVARKAARILAHRPRYGS